MSDTYRNVAVSGEECASLRDMERLFRRISHQTGSARFGVFADTLDLLARRHERAAEIGSLRDEILGPHSIASVTSIAEAAARRRHLRVVEPGGTAA